MIINFYCSLFVLLLFFFQKLVRKNLNANCHSEYLHQDHLYNYFYMLLFIKDQASVKERPRLEYQNMQTDLCLYIHAKN